LGTGRSVPLTRIIQCAVPRRQSSVGANPTRQLVAPAGSNRSGSGGDKTTEAFEVEGRLGRLGEHAGRNVSERRAGLEKGDVGADPPGKRGRPPSLVSMSVSSQGSHRGSGAGMHVQGDWTQHGKPRRVEARDLQPDFREEQAGPVGVAEGPAVPGKPGNAGGGKGPWFKVSAGSGESQEIGSEPTNSGEG